MGWQKLVLILITILIILIALDNFTKRKINVPQLTSVYKPTKVISTGQELTCKALSLITKRPVVYNYRKAGIINPKTKKPLEIDCFDGKIGVEYNGIQHYVFPNRFHVSAEEFEAQKRRDREKLEQARKLRVPLIIVPYYIDSCVMTPEGPKRKQLPKETRFVRIYSYLKHVIRHWDSGNVPPHELSQLCNCK